jgi:hypothetical protein
MTYSAECAESRSISDSPSPDHWGVGAFEARTHMITNVVDHDLRQSSGDLFHSQRVGELVIAVLKELRDHSTCHGRSRTDSPEVQVFDEFTQSSTWSQLESPAESTLAASCMPAKRHLCACSLFFGSGRTLSRELMTTSDQC